MASPHAIREVRLKHSTTFGTSFLNAAAALGNWLVSNTSIKKIRPIVFDDSGLTQEGVQDPTLQQYLFTDPAPIVGLRKGTCKISVYLGGAYANLDVNPEAELMNCFMGGCQSPSNARSTTVATSGSGTVNIACASANTYCGAGMMALIGTRGDGGADGLAYPIAGVAAEYFNVGVACPAAPASGAPIVFGTTVYVQESAAQQYIDGLFIGHATADQRQMIGAMGTVDVTGIMPGENPKIDMTFSPGDHRYVPANERAALTPATAMQGGNPPQDKGLGMFHLGDFGSTTMQRVKAGGFNLTTGITYEAIPDPNGVNGIGGFQKIKGRPSLEATVLMDEDMLGLAADFDANAQAKKIILQLGHQATKCVAIHYPKGHQDHLPVPAVLNNLAAVKVKIHADKPAQTDDLAGSPFTITWF
jgi:hypothetical protein